MPRSRIEIYWKPAETAPERPPNGCEGRVLSEPLN
jgi:hypothetical protein